MVVKNLKRKNSNLAILLILSISVRKMEFLITDKKKNGIPNLKNSLRSTPRSEIPFFLIESPTTLGPGGEGGLLYKACTGVI